MKIICVIFLKMIGRLKIWVFNFKFLFLSWERLSILLIKVVNKLLFLRIVFIIECCLGVNCVFWRREDKVIIVCMGVCILWFIIVRKLFWVCMVVLVLCFVRFKVIFCFIRRLWVFMDFFRIVVCDKVIVICIKKIS